MTLNIQQLLLLGIATSTVHWLIARSKVMEWFWSSTTGTLDALLRCAGCSGWWLGLGAGVAGLLPVTGLPRVLGVFAAGLLAVFVTPVFESVLLWGLSNAALDNIQDEIDESAHQSSIDLAALIQTNLASEFEPEDVRAVMAHINGILGLDDPPPEN